MRRKGRGWLSSIELLPPEAQPIVSWARDELTRRERHQIDILAEFNERLAKLGAELGHKLGPISLSAFNRVSVRLATWARRQGEVGVIAKALGERRQPRDVDDLTLLAGEAVKTLIVELIEGAEEGSIDPKEAMALGRALHAATSAESVSARRRHDVEKNYAARASKAIDAVAKAKGLSAEVVADLRRRVLGVRT